MDLPKLIRAGGLAAILAGAFNAAQGIPNMFDNTPTDLTSLADYLVEVTFGMGQIALLITLVALVRLHTWQDASSYGWLGRIGFFAAFIGSVLMVVKTSLIVVLGLAFGAQVVTDIVVVFMVLYMAGSLLQMLGLVLLGIATLRVGVLPRWIGLSLILIPFAGPVFGGNSPYVELPFWIAIGYGLLSYTRTRGFVRAQSAAVR